MAEIKLPSELKCWVGKHMPDAPNLERVRVFCGPAIPFDWLPGNRGKYIGITLWNRIWLREPFELKREDEYELLFHELVHVRQFQRNPLWFPLSYLISICWKGYADHPAEIEARAVSAGMRETYFGADKFT